MVLLSFFFDAQPFWSTNKQNAIMPVLLACFAFDFTNLCHFQVAIISFWLDVRADFCCCCFWWNVIRCHFYGIRSLSVTYVLAAKKKIRRNTVCQHLLFSLHPFAKTSQCAENFFFLLESEEFFRVFSSESFNQREKKKLQCYIRRYKFMERIHDFLRSKQQERTKPEKA